MSVTKHIDPYSHPSDESQKGMGQETSKDLIVSVKKFFSTNKVNERDVESLVYFDTEECLWKASCSVLFWTVPEHEETPTVKETWGSGNSPNEAIEDAVNNWTQDFGSKVQD